MLASTQVEIIRNLLVRKLDAVRLYLSMCSPPPLEAIHALSTPTTVTRMVDCILSELGHGSVPVRGGEIAPAGTLRQGSRRLHRISKRLKGPRGVSRKEFAQLQAAGEVVAGE